MTGTNSGSAGSGSGSALAEVPELLVSTSISGLVSTRQYTEVVAAINKASNNGGFRTATAVQLHLLHEWFHIIVVTHGPSARCQFGTALALVCVCVCVSFYWRMRWIFVVCTGACAGLCAQRTTY